MSDRVLCLACFAEFTRPTELDPGLPATHCHTCIAAGELGMDALERYEASRAARLAHRAEAEAKWSEDCGRSAERKAKRERRQRDMETIVHPALA